MEDIPEESFRQFDKEYEKKQKVEFHRRMVLLAKLASLPSLKALDGKAKEQLIKEAQDAGVGGLLGRFTTRRTEDGKAERALGVDSVSDAWVAMWLTYPLARKIINALLDGKKVRLPARRREVQLDRQQLGILVAWPTKEKEWAAEDLLNSLLRSLTLAPFPYRRCPACMSGIFVPVRHQEYCSTKCRSRVYEAERKDDPQRKAAVLKNMERYRRKLKNKKQAKEKRPVVTLRGTSQGKHG
jgi:hypothetical protein